MQSCRFKCLFLLFLLVATAGILFILSSSPVHETEMSSLGIIAENYVWKKRSISVCWAQKQLSEELPQFSILRTLEHETVTELNDIDKSVIQNKVQEQFNKSMVGIEFVGWQRCDPSVKSDIYIFALDELTYAEYFPPGEADIGTSCQMFNLKARKKEIRKRMVGQPGYLFLSKATIKTLGPKLFKNPEVSLVRVALHEFGHIVGLIHEHYHKGAKQDPNCQELIKENPNFSVNPVDLGKDKAYSEYDAQSIMNECFLMKEDLKDQQSIADVRLSELDRHTLQCIYKSADQYDKSKCHRTDYQ